MKSTYCIDLILIFVIFSLPLSAMCTPVADRLAHLDFGDPHPQTGLALATDGRGDIWVKGEISPELLSRQLVLHIPSGHVVDYDLYVYHGDRLLRPVQDSNEHGQKIRTRYPLYTFSTENPVYYLNFKQNPVSKLKVSIQESTQYFYQESTDLMRIYLYYGLIIMAMIFNVVFFLIFLDKHFATYVLLQASLLCTFFLEDGMLHYFYPHIAHYFHYLLTWVSSISAVLAVMFTYYLLDLKQNSTWFRKVAFPVVAVLLVGCGVYVWTGSVLVRIIVNVSCFSLAGLCFYQAAVLFKDLIYARLLLLAFGFLVLMGGLYTLNEFYDNSLLSFFDVNGLRLASVIEIVAVSFALIFKVRFLREENERQREELRYQLEQLKSSRHEKQMGSITHAPIPLDLPTISAGHQEEGIIHDIGMQYQLTEREKEVLRCIWNGDSNQEIANKLCISINTTKFHVGRLYGKLNVRNRSEVRSMREEVVEN